MDRTPEDLGRVGIDLGEVELDPHMPNDDQAPLPPPVSGGFMAAYFFAQYAAWMAIFTPVIITVALKVNAIAPGLAKNEGLGRVLAAGAFCALIAGPLWGAVSDRTRSRFGRRRVWIAAGSLMLLVGLVIVASSSSILQLGIGWMICQTGANATQASMYAVMSDTIPPSQRGRMSGILGLAIPFALVTGTFVTQFTSGNDYAMFLVPWLPSLIALPLFLRKLPPGPATVIPPFHMKAFLGGFWISPVKHPDFAWVFTSKFLITLAAAFSQTYQVYYFIDHLHIAPARVATYVFMSKLTVAGLTMVLTPLSGWLSDRIGRIKPFVFLPAVMVAAGLAVISVSNTLPVFLIGVIMVGIGQSVYGAVDVALCVAVLPDRANSARYMGVVQIASSLPQSIAPAVAPFLLVIGGEGQNYLAMFLFAAFLGVLGAVTVLPVRKVA